MYDQAYLYPDINAQLCLLSRYEGHGGQVFYLASGIALTVLHAPKREGISASVGYRLILEPWATMCVHTRQRSHSRRTSCPMNLNEL